MEKTNNQTIYQKLFQIQQEIGAIEKTKENPFYKSAYADINDYLAVVKPVLSKYNLILLQPLEITEGSNLLTTRIIDVDSKEEIKSSIRLPENPDPQKVGSIITYFRRFSIQSLLALQAEDDDAQKASVPEKPKEQVLDGQQLQQVAYSKKKIARPNDPASDAQKKLIYKLLKEQGFAPQDFVDEVQGLTKGQASKRIEQGISDQKKKGDLPTVDDGDWNAQQQEEEESKSENR